MPHARSDDLDIYYECHGSEGPGLIFAHGAGGNATSWWQQIPEFAALYRVISFDHRGFARSPCKPEALDPGRFEQDLCAVMDAAEMERATIVCQSMGGWTGARMAVYAPQRVDGVLLANTAGAIMNDAVRTNVDQLMERIRNGGGLGNLAISAEFITRDPARALLYQQIAAFNPGILPNIEDPSIYVSAEQVRQSQIPFMVLRSDLDPLFPDEVLANVAADIDCPTVRVNGAGHSTYFEKPEAFNAHLSEFLRSVYG